MNHFRIGVVFLICVAFLMLSDCAVFAQGAVNSSPERLVFPTAKGQKEFGNWVGLEKGSGPWADYYKPVPLHMYWSPKNHYIRPDFSAFKELFGDYASGDCLGCHTLHKFSAEEARKPEACYSCHMGADHPDAETYKDSKMGIYSMGDVIAGKLGVELLGEGSL